jgi:nuclear pore complex protein Nup62
MDEILTRWATDMSRYSKEFKEHAETIARWDQLIVDNSSKIDKLYVRTRTAERQTVSVDIQLTAVENSQSELEAWLTKYENDVDEMLAKDSAAPSELGGPDQERERTYKLAEKLGERLNEMERDLGGMVEEVNAANASLSRNGKGAEPVRIFICPRVWSEANMSQITQIVKILNSHLVQLQAIDQGTQALQEKVAAAQKAASQLGYLNGSSLNGTGGAAVQDFYRSYMGRRS